MLKLTLAASLMAATLIQGCSLKPSATGKNEEPRGQLSFSIEEGTLTRLSERVGMEPSLITIEAFRVKNDKRGSRDGPLNQFTAVAGATYTIQNVGIGLREFYAEVLSEDSLLMAQGSTRHLVVMGPQQVEDLVLKAIKRAKLRLEVGVGLKGSDPESFTRLAGVPASEPPEVKAIMTKYLCHSCHKVGSPQGGLILDVFPYESTKDGIDFDAVMNLIVERCESSSAPMPPFGDPLSEAEMTVLKALRDGTLGDNGGGDPGDLPEVLVRGEATFNGVALQLEITDGRLVSVTDSSPVVVVGKPYDFGLKLFGESDVLLFEAKDVSMSPDEAGLVTWNVEIPYEAPRVGIKIHLE